MTDEKTKEKNDNLAEMVKITKVNDRIYLGAWQHPADNTEEFQQLGVDVIINCAAELGFPDNSPLYKKYIIEDFPIYDDQHGTLLEHMDRAITVIRKYYKAGKKIYVHCSLGISRAPAILVYYFMFYKHISFDRALHLLKKKRKIIELNENFERELKEIDSDP